MSNINPDCNSTSNVESYQAGTIANDLNDRQWICFRTEKQEGVYNYSKLQVDLTPPKIKVAQDGNTVNIESPDSIETLYFIAGKEPACDSGDSTEYINLDNSINVADQQWVCIRLKNPSWGLWLQQVSGWFNTPKQSTSLKKINQCLPTVRT